MGGKKKKIRPTCCAWLCLSAAELVYTLPERMCVCFFFFSRMSEG